VLLVRATEARDVLPRELEALGVRVTVAPAYRTTLARRGAAEVLALLESHKLDVVTFTSSSTVRGFLALLAPADARRLLEGVIVAAIGPITAETAAQHGLHVSIMPHEYTVPALADAIAGHFETSPPAALRG
jgi:uroporphyrinogen III methyltransferase/synthase